MSADIQEPTRRRRTPRAGARAARRRRARDPGAASRGSSPPWGTSSRRRGAENAAVAAPASSSFDVIVSDTSTCPARGRPHAAARDPAPRDPRRADLAFLTCQPGPRDRHRGHGARRVPATCSSLRRRQGAARPRRARRAAIASRATRREAADTLESKRPRRSCRARVSLRVGCRPDVDGDAARAVVAEAVGAPMPTRRYCAPTSPRCATSGGLRRARPSASGARDLGRAIRRRVADQTDIRPRRR